MAFDIVKGIHAEHFDNIVANGVYTEFVNCLTEFCKNGRFGKTGLQAVELIRKCIEQSMGMVGDGDDLFVKFWYPALFSLQVVVVTCDLEVRTRYFVCINCLGH